MKKNCAVILAAGEGKRMKSNKPKVLLDVLFKPMIDWVTDAVKSSGIMNICVVAGHKSEQLCEYLDSSYNIALQNERLGTGHAVMQAVEYIKLSGAENVLILNGDAPLIDNMTISESLSEHIRNNNAVTVVSAFIDRPYGYGRIVRNKNGSLMKIVEQKDADETERLINEVNSGVYWFNSEALIDALSKISSHNAQNEYYLTDAVEIILNEGKNVSAYITENSSVVLGANDRVQLMELNEVARMMILKANMLSGVDIPCIDGVIIGSSVKIGKDTIILPNTIIRGKTKIGEDCEIGPNCLIENSNICNNVKLNNVQMRESKINSGTDVGPFAQIRPNCELHENIHVGNFVELKNSVIDDGSKIPHLTYIGDSDIGKGVNFGCGSLTVNYNGKEKFRTVVKDKAFIGCNTNLIAPVTVGEYAYTAAGSTITKDVPAFALSIARAQQVNKENWVSTRKPFKGMD